MDQGQKIPSQINDDELTQMIAGLKNASTTAMPTTAPVNNAVPTMTNSPVATVKNSPIVPQQATSTNPIASNVPTPVESVQTNDIPEEQPLSVPAIDNLESIKRNAILELRPLVNKLNLPAEDKFDTLLLLIRTTDDASLIPEAHRAATSIADDTRRAQALLDVIKEIDFFDRKK